jgi:hypothetical protein
MNDLLDFLRAQLDAREREVTGSGTLGWLTYRRPDGSISYTIPAALAEDGTWIAAGQVAKGYASAVIVHREADVLAEVDAKRRIIAMHATGDFPYDPDDGPGDYSWTERCDGCGEATPCLTLRLLALPFAGRPGYRDEWRP